MMMNSIFWGLVFTVTHSIIAQPLVTQTKGMKLMGCEFALRVVAIDEAIAWNAINAGETEIIRIEKLISSWDSNSQTSLINKNAGIKAIQVDQELYDLISRTKKVSALTNGAFDISFASIDRLYNFDGLERELPNHEMIAKSREKINWEDIELLEHRMVFLRKKGMKIGFGGIGKGYAANKAKRVMENIKGVEGGIVNASGDLLIWGKTSTESDKWNISIADPQNSKQRLVDVDVHNTAVVTSGNYEKFFTSKGTRYSHIIDPRSGLPTTGIKSVSIICPDAELADALATSVFVLGIEEGLFLVDKLKGIECIILTDNDQIMHSKNLKLNYN